MSIDIDRVLADCPEYVAWSNQRLQDNQDHYDSDPDYQRWAESFSDDGESDEDESMRDVDRDVDVDVSTPPPVITAEEQAFFDTYCL